MALPIDGLLLSLVVSEIGLPPDADLGECFASANSRGFDSTYVGSKDRLSNFKNYNHSVLTNPTNVVLATYNQHTGLLAATWDIVPNALEYTCSLYVDGVLEETQIVTYDYANFTVASDSVAKTSYFTLVASATGWISSETVTSNTVDIPAMPTLATPTNVIAADNQIGSITVSWDEVPNAYSYMVESFVDDVSTGIVEVSDPTVDIAVPQTPNMQTYHAVVYAKAPGYNNSASATSNDVPVPGKLAPPDITLHPWAAGSMTADWPAVPNATEYEVKWIVGSSEIFNDFITATTITVSIPQTSFEQDVRVEAQAHAPGYDVSPVDTALGVVPPLVIVPGDNYSEDFESGTLGSEWSHKSSNLADWFITAGSPIDGTSGNVLRSGDMTGASSVENLSGIELTIETTLDDRQITVNMFKSSESYDTFHVYVDNVEVEEFTEEEIPRESVSFPLGSAGIKVILFLYTKDSSVDDGQDLVYIDDVVVEKLTIGKPTNLAMPEFPCRDCSGGDGRVVASWDAVPGADHYRVEFRTNSYGGGDDHYHTSEDTYSSNVEVESPECHWSSDSRAMNVDYTVWAVDADGTESDGAVSPWFNRDGACG
jgi:hypothetical protein